MPPKDLPNGGKWMPPKAVDDGGDVPNAGVETDHAENGGHIHQEEAWEKVERQLEDDKLQQLAEECSIAGRALIPPHKPLEGFPLDQMKESGSPFFHELAALTQSEISRLLQCTVQPEVERRDRHISNQLVEKNIGLALKDIFEKLNGYVDFALRTFMQTVDEGKFSKEGAKLSSADLNKSNLKKLDRLEQIGVIPGKFEDADTDDNFPSTIEDPRDFELEIMRRQLDTSIKQSQKYDDQVEKLTRRNLDQTKKFNEIRRQFMMDLQAQRQAYRKLALRAAVYLDNENEDNQEKEDGDAVTLFNASDHYGDEEGGGSNLKEMLAQKVAEVSARYDHEIQVLTAQVGNLRQDVHKHKQHAEEAEERTAQILLKLKAAESGSRRSVDDQPRKTSKVVASSSNDDSEWKHYTDTLVNIMKDGEVKAEALTQLTQRLESWLSEDSAEKDLKSMQNDAKRAFKEMYNRTEQLHNVLRDFPESPDHDYPAPHEQLEKTKRDHEKLKAEASAMNADLERIREKLTSTLEAKRAQSDTITELRETLKTRDETLKELEKREAEQGEELFNLHEVMAENETREEKLTQELEKQNKELAKMKEERGASRRSIRQSLRTEVEDELKETLKMQMQESAGAELTELQAKLDELTEKCESLEKDNTELREAKLIRENEDTKAALKKNVPEEKLSAARKASLLEARTAEEEAKLKEDLIAEVEQLKETNAELHSELEKAKAEKTELDEAHGVTENALQGFHSQISDLNTELNAAHAKVEGLEAELEKYKVQERRATINVHAKVNRRLSGNDELDLESESLAIGDMAGIERSRELNLDPNASIDTEGLSEDPNATANDLRARLNTMEMQMTQERNRFSKARQSFDFSERSKRIDVEKQNRIAVKKERERWQALMPRAMSCPRYLAKARDTIETSEDFRRQRYTVHAGMLGESGEDSILIENMSVHDAKKKCHELEGCKGFTFKGPVKHEHQVVEIHFKNKFKLQTMNGWKSYRLLPQDDAFVAKEAEAEVQIQREKVLYAMGAARMALLDEQPRDLAEAEKYLLKMNARSEVMLRSVVSLAESVTKWHTDSVEGQAQFQFGQDASELEIGEMRKLLTAAESQRNVGWELQRRYLLRCQRAFEELHLDDVVRIPKALLGSCPEFGADLESLFVSDSMDPSKARGDLQRRANHAKLCAVQTVGEKIQSVRSRSQHAAAKLQAVHAREELLNVDMMEAEIRQKLGDRRSTVMVEDMNLVCSSQESEMNENLRRIRTVRRAQFRKANIDDESQGDVSIDEACDIVKDLCTVSNCDTSVGGDLSDPEMSDDDDILHEVTKKNRATQFQMFDADKSTTAASEPDEKDILLDRLMSVVDIDVADLEKPTSEHKEIRVETSIEATPQQHHEPLHRRKYRIRPMDKPDLEIMVPRPIEEELNPQLVMEEGRRVAGANPDDVAAALAAGAKAKTATKFMKASVAAKAREDKALRMAGALKRGADKAATSPSQRIEPFKPEPAADGSEVFTSPGSEFRKRASWKHGLKGAMGAVGLKKQGSRVSQVDTGQMVVDDPNAALAGLAGVELEEGMMEGSPSGNDAAFYEGFEEGPAQQTEGAQQTQKPAAGTTSWGALAKIAGMSGRLGKQGRKLSQQKKEASEALANGAESPYDEYGYDDELAGIDEGGTPSSGRGSGRGSGRSPRSGHASSRQGQSRQSPEVSQLTMAQVQEIAEGATAEAKEEAQAEALKAKEKLDAVARFCLSPRPYPAAERKYFGVGRRLVNEIDAEAWQPWKDPWTLGDDLDVSAGGSKSKLARGAAAQIGMASGTFSGTGLASLGLLQSSTSMLGSTSSIANAFRRKTTGEQAPPPPPPKPPMEDAEMQTDPPPPPPETKELETQVQSVQLIPVEDQTTQTMKQEKAGQKVQSTQTERPQNGVDRDELSRRFMIRAQKKVVMRRSTVGEEDPSEHKHVEGDTQADIGSPKGSPKAGKKAADASFDTNNMKLDLNFARHQGKAEGAPGAPASPSGANPPPSADQAGSGASPMTKANLGLSTPKKGHKRKGGSKSLAALMRKGDSDEEAEQPRTAKTLADLMADSDDEDEKKKKTKGPGEEDAPEVDDLEDAPDDEGGSKSIPPQVFVGEDQSTAGKKSIIRPLSRQDKDTDNISPKSTHHYLAAPAPTSHRAPEPDYNDEFDQMVCEVVDVEQQTDILWEDVAQKVLEWLKFNLMQRQQAELYAGEWTPSPVPGFEWDQQRRDDCLRSFEDFLKRIMCLESPTKREQRRGLRALYDEAAEEASSQRGSVGNIPSSNPDPKDKAEGKQVEKPSEKMGVLIGNKSSEAQPASGKSQATGVVVKGIAHKRSEEGKPQQSLPSMVSVEGMDLLPRDLNIKKEALFPSESPTQGMTGLTDLLSSVLGFKLDPPGLPGVQQDVYCLEHASRRLFPQGYQGEGQETATTKDAEHQQQQKEQPKQQKEQPKQQKEQPKQQKEQPKQQKEEPKQQQRQLIQNASTSTLGNNPSDRELPSYVQNQNATAGLPLDAARRDRSVEQEVQVQDFQGLPMLPPPERHGLVERADKAEKILKNVKQQGLGGADVVSKWLRQLEDADTVAAGALSEIAGTSPEDRQGFMKQANPVRRGLMAALKDPNEGEPWVGTRIEGLAAKIAAGQAHDNVIARASFVSAALVNTLQALKQRRHAAGTLLRFGFARLRINARQAARAEFAANQDAKGESGGTQQSMEQSRALSTPQHASLGLVRSISSSGSEPPGGLGNRQNRPGRTLTISSQRGPRAPDQEADEDSGIKGLGSSDLELSKRSSAGSSVKWRAGAGLKPSSQRSALQFAQKADAFIGAVAWSYTGKPNEQSESRGKPSKLQKPSKKYAGQDDTNGTNGDAAPYDDQKARRAPMPTPDPSGMVMSPTPIIAGKYASKSPVN